MATVKEIEVARKTAVRRLDLQVVEAVARRNASSSDSTRVDLDDLIDDMMLARTRLNTAAVEAMDNSPEMQEALEVLEQASIELTRVAEHAKKLAEFMLLAAAFAGAGTKLAEVLEEPKDDEGASDQDS